MKKRVVILFLCMTMVLSMGACGTDSDKKASTQQGTQETASEVFDGPAQRTDEAGSVKTCDETCRL